MEVSSSMNLLFGIEYIQYVISHYLFSLLLICHTITSTTETQFCRLLNDQKNVVLSQYLHLGNYEYQKKKTENLFYYILLNDFIGTE